MVPWFHMRSYRCHCYCSLLKENTDLAEFIIPPANKVWGYIEITPSVCSSVRLSRVNLTLAIIFEPKEIRLSYYICGFLGTRPFFRTKTFDLVTLTLTFDLLFNTFVLVQSSCKKCEDSRHFRMKNSCPLLDLRSQPSEYKEKQT